MSFENSDNAQTFGSKLSQNWNRNAFQNADISPNWASVRISAPLPNPIKRPTIKVESETKNLDQPCLTTQPPAGDVWSYVPDYVLNSWRSSQGIPGNFFLVDISPTSPVLQWQGPNIMNASTGIIDVFKYVKEKLDIYWMEWVEFHITGYSPRHYPPQPVWRRTEAFHVHISSHLSDCDGLGAVREEAFQRDRMFDTPYLQVIIRIRPPRLKWLAQAHPEKSW